MAGPARDEAGVDCGGDSAAGQAIDRQQLSRAGIDRSAGINGSHPATESWLHRRLIPPPASACTLFFKRNFFDGDVLIEAGLRSLKRARLQAQARSARQGSLIFGPSRGLLLLALFKRFNPPARAKIYTGELTLTAWGVANLTMTIWNYVDTPENRRDPLTLARVITNVTPGQVGRFLFVPDIQKPYPIPAAIGGILMVLGYIGSAGCAFAQIDGAANDDSDLAEATRTA